MVVNQKNGQACNHVCRVSGSLGGGIATTLPALLLLVVMMTAHFAWSAPLKDGFEEASVKLQQTKTPCRALEVSRRYLPGPSRLFSWRTPHSGDC